MRYFAFFAAASIAATTAQADITLAFYESAPKDRFVLTSASCPLSDITVEIDLSPSAGRLIFDVTGAGAGVEVFQPVEVQQGTASVIPVVDGDQVLRFDVAALPAGETLVISADLDDVLDQSDLGQIRVAGSELDGATVMLDGLGPQVRATFQDGTNRISLPHSCVS